MERDLRDKVVIITGGAEGLGLTIAEVFLQKGAKTVALLDINEKLGTAAATSLTKKYGHNKVSFFKCNVVTDLENIFKHVIDTYKHVDVLVNSAGISNEFDPKKAIDINVTALIEWSLKFWEHMRTDKGGKGGTIINLASVYGFRIDQYVPVYKASKFAVMGFTKSLGHQYNYERSGVRVYAICPGYTYTSFVKDPYVSNDAQVREDLEIFMKQQLWQSPDAVGRCAAETFEKADSGTAWMIEGNKPIEQVKRVMIT